MKREIKVDGETIKSERESTYVKMVGGNINALSTSSQDYFELKQKCVRFQGKFLAHPVSISLMCCLLDAMAMMGWVHRNLISWPADILHEKPQVKFETARVCATVARACRVALYLPIKTAQASVFGPESEGCIQMPHPAKKMFVAGAMELRKAAFSPHRWVRESTQYELCRSLALKQHTLYSGERYSDTDLLAMWCHSVCIDLELITGKGDKWECSLPAFDTDCPFLILTADTSANKLQSLWGIAAVVATVEGEILCVMRARLPALFASTTLLEGTAVTEGVKALRKALQGHKHSHLKIWPWCDNKAAAEGANVRDVVKQMWKFDAALHAEQVAMG